MPTVPSITCRELTALETMGAPLSSYTGDLWVALPPRGARRDSVITSTHADPACMYADGKGRTLSSVAADNPDLWFCPCSLCARHHPLWAAATAWSPVRTVHRLLDWAEKAMSSRWRPRLGDAAGFIVRSSQHLATLEEEAHLATADASADDRALRWSLEQVPVLRARLSACQARFSALTSRPRSSVPVDGHAHWVAIAAAGTWSGWAHSSRTPTAGGILAASLPAVACPTFGRSWMVVRCPRTATNAGSRPCVIAGEVEDLGAVQHGDNEALWGVFVDLVDTGLDLADALDVARTLGR